MIVSQVRQLLHHHVSPDGPNSMLVPARINELCERFFVSGKWKGMLVEVSLDATEGYVTLPRRCESILGITVQKAPRTPFGRWYSFSPGGPGEVDLESYSGPDVVVDQGDGFVTYKDSPYESFRLRLKVPNASDRNDGNSVIIKGTDSTGKTVYNSDGEEGLVVNLSASENTTTQYFSTITSITKSPTLGYVTLWAVDASNAETQIGDYEPGETNISYRRYRVTRADTSEVPTVNALCKRRYVPVVSENDDVIPGNMGALKLGLISLKYEDTNDLERATEYFTRALSLLNAELREQRGGQINTMRFSPHGFGLSRVAKHY